MNTETKKVIYTLDEDHPFERELIEDESYKNNEMVKDKSALPDDIYTLSI